MGVASHDPIISIIRDAMARCLPAGPDVARGAAAVTPPRIPLRRAAVTVGGVVFAIGTVMARSVCV